MSNAMAITEKASAIRLLLLDVDGVMTDGRITLNEEGQETKGFNVKDGQGLRMLMQAGVDVVIISGRRSRAVEFRGKDLGIQEIHQGISDKATLCREILKHRNLEKGHVCCIGDDLPDLPLFDEVGLAVAVADAVPELRKAAGFRTSMGGGNGAVREVCELILKAKQRWPYDPPEAGAEED